MTIARTLFGLLVAASVLAAVGCRGDNAASQREGTHSTETDSAALSPSAAQALRTCVDRWNQANMLHWGPAFVDVSVRRLGATQLAAVGLRNPARARCVVSFAFESRADPRTGCSGRAPVPEKPGWCLDRTGTFACAINPFGAYNCPLIHEPLGPPLTKKNATTDKRGVLKLDASLKSTLATPPLAWHRYPHRDGFIEPWTRAGKLRPGMKLTGKHRGTCSPGSEETHATSELRCLTGNGVGRFYLRFDPCFPPPGDWNRRGVVVACASPGATTFSRFAITERS